MLELRWIGFCTLVSACLFVGSATSTGQCPVQKLIHTDFEVTGIGSGDFGRALAIHGDLAVISAPRATTPGVTQHGRVWVFERVEGQRWAVQAELTPAGLGSFDRIGEAVAFDGTTVLFNAGGATEPVHDSGAVYVYELVDGEWVQEAKLTPDQPMPSAYFGSALALDGDRAVIGTRFSSVGAADADSVYVFERTDGVWEQTARLTATTLGDIDSFGYSVALSGSWIAVGVPHDAIEGVGEFVGTVRMFEERPEGWVEVQRLGAPFAGWGDDFGTALALSGDLLVVGAPDHDHFEMPLAHQEGAGFAFVREGATWELEEVLWPLQTHTFLQWRNLGTSVAIDGDRVLLGAPTDNLSGPAWMFERDAGDWLSTGPLDVPDKDNPANPGNTSVGYSVDLDGNTIMMGAPQGGVPSGAVYVYESLPADCPPLFGAPEMVSLGNPGTLSFQLRGGVENAGNPYFMLGSASGTSPGFPTVVGVLPLSVDAYTQFTIAAGNDWLGNGQSLLDAEGNSDTFVFLSFHAPPPELAGVTLHHAFVVLSPALTPVLVSNAVPVRFID